MKKYLCSNEFSKKDIDNYRVKFADYLEGLFQVEDVSELSDAEIVQVLKVDFANAVSEFDRSFHYQIKDPAIVMVEKDKYFEVVDVAKKDIHNSINLCTGDKQEYYIEDGEFKFNGTSCGEMLVRFAKDGSIFEKGDTIAKQDLNTFTKPIGGWLEKRIEFDKNEMLK